MSTNEANPGRPLSSIGMSGPRMTMEESRRNALNMERMIKKNVMGISRPGGAKKRGFAVVEHFKQLQQQDENKNEHTDPSASIAKRTKDNTPVVRSTVVSPMHRSSIKSANIVPGATLNLNTRQSPVRQKFTSPTRRLTSPLRTINVPIPIPTTVSHPELNVDKPEVILKTPSLPSKSPFVSFQSKLVQSRTNPSPPRTHTSPIPTRPPTPSSTSQSHGITAHSVRTAPSPINNISLESESVSDTKPITSEAARPVRTAPSPIIDESKSVSDPKPITSEATRPLRSGPFPIIDKSASVSDSKLVMSEAALPIRTTPSSIIDISLESESDPKLITSEAATTSSPTESVSDSNLSTSEEIKQPKVSTKPLARVLFSSSSSIAFKSQCFSTEGVATSLDVSVDGESIVVAFTDGSIRLYEMDATVPSDRYGYLLGHIDEESTSNSAIGAHLRVKITPDGHYAFVGCRSGPRIIMSINLHHYRHGKENEDEDQLQKSFYTHGRLRGFADVTMTSDTIPCSSYYLLFGLGIGTLHVWQFTESSVYTFLYSINANGNTAMFASFIRSSDLNIAVKCLDKNIRVWSLKKKELYHVMESYVDIPHTNDIVSFYGEYAYGIAPSGNAYRFKVELNTVRQEFELERYDGTTTNHLRRNGVILETIHASTDGNVVVALSTEGIMYYAKDIVFSSSQTTRLQVIGRNVSSHSTYKSPMKVYHPHSSLNAVMCIVTNPLNEEHGQGYMNVDPTETWAARWMVPSQGKDCWVCGVRNIAHWPKESIPRIPSSSSSKPRSCPKSKSSMIEKKKPSSPRPPPPLPRPKSPVSPNPSPLNLEQELHRYKERYHQIVTEWQRRLQGERQMRRLWKQRESEFQTELTNTTMLLQQKENELSMVRTLQKEKEKEMIYENLKKQQQDHVKQQYQQLCQQVETQMVQLEQQQRVMEQTTKTLLQEIDRHIAHRKQQVSTLIDTSQHECIVCKDQTAVIAIVPCGHVCFCEQDAQIYQQRCTDLMTCPICQSEGLSFLRIY